MDRRTFCFGTGAFLIGLENLVLGDPLGKFNIEKPPTNKHLTNSISRDGEILTIYFLTNSWMLFKNDRKDLWNFFKIHKDKNFIVEGYADNRGSYEDNIKLGYERATSIEHYLKGFEAKGKIDITSYGESKPLGEGNDFKTLQKNRRVLIIANENPIHRAFNLLKADYYLVDASSSMIENGKWDTVTKYKYPNSSHVYIFNSLGLREVKDKISSYLPEGGTPLWKSTYELLDIAENGKSITLLSDGQDNESNGVNPDMILTRAKEKKINLNTLAVKTGQDTENLLANISNQTGGKSYSIR